jgi:hypothetical protein
VTVSDSTQDAIDRGDEFNPTPDPVKDAPAAEPEVTQEPVEEAKEEPVEEAKEERVRDDKGKFIPKDRFDEAVRKERSEKEALANRLKEYEAKEAQRNVAADLTEANKAVKDMIKQHTSLLADGELDKAADLMEQILELKEEISDRRATAKAETAKVQAKEEVRYDALVAKLEADYPMINPDADEFDRDAVKRVQAYMTGLMQTERMSPSQALKAAVETMLTKKADPAPAAEKASEAGMRRKEDAVKKALEAKGKQPPSTKDVGLDHDKTGGAMDASAVMKMSWDEFVRLPESKLAELRGDFV